MESSAVNKNVAIWVMDTNGDVVPAERMDDTDHNPAITAQGKARAVSNLLTPGTAEGAPPLSKNLTARAQVAAFVPTSVEGFDPHDCTSEGCLRE